MNIIITIRTTDPRGYNCPTSTTYGCTGGRTVAQALREVAEEIEADERLQATCDREAVAHLL